VSQFGEKAATMAEDRAESRSYGVQCRITVSVGSLAWMLANRRLTVRYERRSDSMAAFPHSAAR
jgi:hypothetical protein